MDTIKTYQQTIEEIFNNYAKLKYAYGEIEIEPIFDYQNNRYLLMSLGWEGHKRIHGCIVHIDIINNKLWIQRDGTEDGIAGDLEEAGISKNQIVLGFRSPEIRKLGEYAVA